MQNREAPGAPFENLELGFSGGGLVAFFDGNYVVQTVDYHEQRSMVFVEMLHPGLELVRPFHKSQTCFPKTGKTIATL